MNKKCDSLEQEKRCTLEVRRDCPTNDCMKCSYFMDIEPLTPKPNEPQAANDLSCPYNIEANNMCTTLINELINADTWARMQDVIWAINLVRSRAKSHIKEWEHLNSPKISNTKGN